MPTSVARGTINLNLQLIATKFRLMLFLGSFKFFPPHFEAFNVVCKLDHPCIWHYIRLKTTIQLNGLITTIGNNEGIATQ